MVDEDKEIDEVRLSTEDEVSTVKEKVSTDFEKLKSTNRENEGNEEIFESTEQQREGTKEKDVSTAGQIEDTEDQTKEEFATQTSQTSTQTPTSMIFDDRLIKTKLKNERFLQRRRFKAGICRNEVKQEDKEEENTRKRKQGTRKKIKSRKRRFKQDTSQNDPSDTENENDELILCLTIAPDKDKEVDYEILDKSIQTLTGRLNGT
ncbi:hypothetical protein Tco_0282888 [Tanacetum coccineum]